MIALVKREDLKSLREGFAESPPVFRRAEESVENDEGRTFAVAFVVQLHRRQNERGGL